MNSLQPTFTNSSGGGHLASNTLARLRALAFAYGGLLVAGGVIVDLSGPAFDAALFVPLLVSLSIPMFGFLGTAIHQVNISASRISRFSFSDSNSAIFGRRVHSSELLRYAKSKPAVTRAVGFAVWTGVWLFAMHSMSQLPAREVTAACARVTASCSDPEVTDAVASPGSPPLWAC